MKVLQVSNKIPYPEKDGGSIAINSITEGLLKSGCEVKLLAMNTKKHSTGIASIPEKFRSTGWRMETVIMDTSVKPLGALFALLRGKSYHVSRFQSKDFSRKLKEILQKEKYDVVQLEGLYLAPYLPVIRQNSDALVILRTHNIEWKIWQKLATEEKNKLKKWYLAKLSKQLRKYEEKVANLFDGIVTISNTDLAYLESTGCKAPLINIPFGIDASKYLPEESKNNNTLFYIGALDWLPNLQGIDWFLKNVWSEIYAKFPDVQFHIAGRNMPESLRSSNYPGVVFHGEVENAKTFMEEYDIMLVPLLAGSGVRIKIIEGMAMGKAIVSTSIGAEGIECIPGRDIITADTREQFTEAIFKCLSDKELKHGLEQNARKFVEEHDDMWSITKQLVGFYKGGILQKQQKIQTLKILYLVSRFPYPLEKGDKLRAYHQLKGLSQNSEVVLYALSDKDVSEEKIKQLEKICNEVKVFKLSTRAILLNLIRTTFKRIPWQVGYFYSRAAQKEIDTMISEYKPDHIFCQLIRTSEYVKKYKNIPKTIDYMDVFSKGIERRLPALPFYLKPLYRAEQRRLVNYETEISDYFNNKIIISEQDRDLIAQPGKNKITVISNGVDSEFFKPVDHIKEYDIIFNGNMSYPPNIESAEYLVHSILPVVLRSNPNVKVLISGVNPSAKVRALASSHVTVSGWVEDIRENFSKAKMLVAPMFMSIGLQNKLLEAMALKIPCITSTLANNALRAKSGESILVADTPEEYAMHIHDLLSDEDEARRIGLNGHNFVIENYRWETENKKLEQVIRNTKSEK